MELLKKLYSIHSMSGKEKKMRKFIKRWVSENVPEADCITDTLGNIYITKGVSKRKTYPVVVAHIDQVQNAHSRDFEALEMGGIIVGYSEKSRAQQGLGADDKNGIWVALKCLLRFNIIKVALFVSEEVGCVGSSAADMTFFDDARFVLQCDRRGAHDLITEAGWTDLCSREFVKAISPELYGYKEESGMLTDVLTLKESGLKVSCLNLSCGYYEPHTNYEFTNVDDLLNCFAFVEHIILTCKDVYPHEYSYSNYYSKYYYDKYDFGFGERYSEFEQQYYDVIKELLQTYPTAAFDDVFWYLSESFKTEKFYESWVRQLYVDVKCELLEKEYTETVKTDI